MNDLRAASCPWCGGKGFIREMSPQPGDSRVTNSPGEPFRISFENCSKCEAIGAIFYKPAVFPLGVEEK